MKRLLIILFYLFSVMGNRASQTTHSSYDEELHKVKINRDINRYIDNLDADGLVNYIRNTNLIRYHITIFVDFIDNIHERSLITLAHFWAKVVQADPRQHNLFIKGNIYADILFRVESLSEFQEVLNIIAPAFGGRSVVIKKFKEALNYIGAKKDIQDFLNEQ